VSLFSLGVFEIVCFYAHKPRTLNDFNEAIRREIRLIDHQLLACVMDDFNTRLENCIQQDGRHLTDFIFKT
jgi:non-ribosomal peptide synthetase component E (peptide arylation enzyme)